MPLEARYRPKAFDKPSALTTSARPELPVIGIGSSGGDFAQYGLAVGSGSGPESFGLGGQTRGARRIVYVVDRSGSMLTTFEAVRRELRTSIGDLRRSQKFHVIFFNAGPPLENRPRKLVSATANQKKLALAFLDEIQSEGATDPIPAMQRAFAVRPDLIYFLTDGDFDPLLLEKLRQWNKDGRVRIFTLAYVSEAGRLLLEQIAREHQGEFKFISEHEIL
ncbi:MAG: VWA domain-containing protein [Planctomycetes bacterium]|nr:VWA domain-containing protein [Planctomycetota bacterium]